MISNFFLPKWTNNIHLQNEEENLKIFWYLERSKNNFILGQVNLI